MESNANKNLHKENLNIVKKKEAFKDAFKYTHRPNLGSAN